MSTFTWQAENEQATEKLGHVLAELLPPGTVVALNGTLGAGKTRLVKAMAAAWQIPAEEVISPTFVLLKEHHGEKRLNHFDVYRIQDDDEFLELGPEEYFDSEGITLLEWADRVANCLPLDHLRIDIEVTGESTRLFTLCSVGSQLAPVLAQIEAELRSA